MGADITFSDGSYFRDSYNDSNLAWVVGLSYWQGKQKNLFIKKLAAITDMQIISWVDKKGIDRSMIPFLKEKRDNLKEKVTKKLKVVSWSV